MMIPARTLSICTIALVLALPGRSGDAFAAADEWRAAAETACLAANDLDNNPNVAALDPIADPSGCGATHPFKVTATADGTVALEPAATLACPMIPALAAWFEQAVQPAAEKHLGIRVAGATVAASYVCRSRNNQADAKMSEHAYANAIDIAAFLTADGRRITVLDGWRGDAAEAAFLRQVHAEACTHFTTVIGPDGDEYHQDHIHVDLAKRGKTGVSRFCQ